MYVHAVMNKNDRHKPMYTCTLTQAHVTRFLPKGPHCPLSKTLSLPLRSGGASFPPPGLVDRLLLLM